MGQTTKYWDAAAGIGNGVGGSATWGTTFSTTATGDASLTTAGTSENCVFQGTAGTVTLSGNQTAASLTFNITGYTINTNSTTTRVLTGPVTLANNVTLNLCDNTTTDKALTISGAITGGTNSIININAYSTGSSLSRVNLNGGTSLPITITGTGFASIVSSATGSVVSGNITGNGKRLNLGATSGNDISFNGIISGTQDIRIAAGSSGGAGLVTFSGANTWIGNLFLNNATSGVTKIGTNNSIPTSSILYFGETSGNGNSIFDLNGKNQTLAGLSNGGQSGGTIRNGTASTTSTLTINGSSTSLSAFSGVLTDGTGITALTKSGSGTLTLSATTGHTMSGGINVNAGTLVFNPASGSPFATATSSVSLDGGTLSTSGIGTSTILKFTTLALTENSIVNLDSTKSYTINFNASNTVSWINSKILTIKGWKGSFNGTTGTKGQLFIGNSASGLISGQLAQIQFQDGSGTLYPATILSSGELVPTAALPYITLDQTNLSQVASGNISLGTTNNLLSNFRVNITNTNATLNSLSFTIGGTFAIGDVTNFKLYTSTSNTFPGGTALSTVNATGLANGNIVTFSTLSQACSVGNRYFWITADLASNATTTNTIVVPILTNGAFTFVLSNFVSNNISAGGTQTIVSIPPTKLVITSISPTSPFVNGNFNVTVQAQTSGNAAANVIANTNISISVNTGTGNLGGTSTGTILAGTNSITINNVTYSTAETGVVLTASRTSGDVLSDGNSSAVNFLAITPTISSSVITFGTQTASTVPITNWTSGNGANRIVVARLTSTSAVAPTNATTYTANTIWGSGSTTGTGNYVVYNGNTPNSVTITGLSGSTSYTFDIYEYNGSGVLSSYYSTASSSSTTTSAPAYHWNGGDITANPAAGGSGSLGTTNAWRQPDATGSQATWADNNSMIFAGTAGNVTVDANRTATSYTFNTTGYTLQNTATFTLTGPITLANDVVLNLAPNVNTTTPANGTLGISSVNGTGNAAITLHGAQSTSSIASRINISTSSSTISVPTTIVSDGGTGTNGYAGYVSTTTGASINGNITNNSALTTIIGATSGNSLTVNGVISGNAGLQLSAGASGGAGTITLNAANTYSGKTIFNAAVSGTIKLGIDNALSSGKDLIMAYSSSNGGILDLNGYNQNIGSLINRSGGGSITNSGASIATLTVNQALDTMFTLAITSKVALIKNGAKLLTLTSGLHTFSGGLTINAGEVRLNPSADLTLTSSAVTLNGGTLGTTGIAASRTINFSTLSLTENSTIDLNSANSHSLKFAASNSIAWTSGKVLTINGWQGTAGAAGTKGKIFVGSTISGLTSTQLAEITFSGFTAGATILSTGEIVPVASNPVSNITFTPNCLTSTTINWSLPGDYNNSVNNVLVFVKQGAAITQSTNNNLVDTYTASADFTTPGTAYEGDAAAFCVFNGDASSINVTGLSSGTTYYVLIHNTYNNTTYSAALTANSTTVTSLSNATNLASINDLNQVTLTWTNPSCFDEMLLIASSNGSISTAPSGNGSAYTANSFYSAGTNTASNEYVVFRGTSTTVTITGLVDGNSYSYKLFTRKGNTWSSGVSILATSNPPAGDYRSKQSGNWTTASTWQRFNGSAWVDAITGQTPDTATTRVTILNGHSVKYDVSSKDVKDLTINTGGKLSAQDSSDNLKYVNVWGNVVCNGTIGNLPATDDISFRVMGEYCYLSGSGSFGCARLTKTDATNVTSNLIILKDITIVRNAAQSTVLYNNCSTSNFFNVTINPSVTVNVGNALHKANVAIDGTDGAGTGFRAGTLLVNGNLNINGDLYATTNNTNTLYLCAIVVGATGTINADKIIASASAAASHSLRVYEGGNLNLSNSSNPISPYSTTNNYFYFTNSGLSLTLSGSADITLEAGLTYKNITCNSTANLIPNGNLTVTGNIEINSGALTLGNNNLSLKGNLTSYGTGGFTMGTGTVTLEGTSVQTINTTGGESFSNLVINNSAGVTLNSDVTVSTLLTLTNGKVSTGANNLTIANSSASSLVSTNGWLNGNLVRNIASNTSTYVFPVGDASTKNTLTFVNNNLTGVNTLTSSFGTKQGNDTGLNVILINKPITSVSSNVWQLTPDANPTGGSYDLYLSILNFGGMADNQFTILRRDDNSSSAADWMIPTGSVNGPMLVSNGYASRTNITTFSRYGVGNTSSPVPVTFFQLSAFEQDEKTIVNWTATEINNKEYEIELSNNGVDFETKASIAGKGTTYNNEKYSVIINEINYKYVRIKQIDFDGKYSYSPVFVIAKNKSLNNEINVFPTIISNQEDIFVKVSSVESTGTSLKIKLVDVLFHQIFEKEITLQQAGNYNLSQEINKNLATGIYFVLINNGLENKSFKIVVE